MAPLPGALVLTLALWLWRGQVDWESGLAVALMLLTTLILRQMSNALQLIRVRSWAVSTVFVILMAVGAPIHRWNSAVMGMGVLFMVYIIGLLVSYQSRKPQVSIFWAVAALSACSLMVPKLLWLVPITILSMMMPLRCCTSRALVALLLGLLLPYEIWGAWNLYNGTIIAAATAQWQAFTNINVDYLLPLFDINEKSGSWGNYLWQSVMSVKVEVVILTVFYGLISIFHFFHTSLDDKTRTRMLFYSVMMHWPVVVAIILLQDAMIWPILCLVSAPLLAHYFVFSRRWMGSLMFYLFLLLCLFLVLRP